MLGEKDMTLKPLESLKPLAKEYASLIAAGIESEDERIKVLRDKLGFSTNETGTSRIEVNNKVHDGNRVGIWKLEQRNGESFFIRDNKFANDFRNWASLEEIPPKKDKRRIVFLGESVARGYLYDPYYCPAKVLEAIMNENLGSYEVEVIDLAKVSIRIEELEQLTLQSMVLKPDYLVIFAGNNWRKSVWSLSEEEICSMLEAMNDEERFDKIQQILESNIKIKIDEYMKKLGEIKNIRKVPVFFIIPEFNLKDWRCNNAESILCWAKGKTNEWLELKEEAIRNINSKNYAEAEKIAKRMIEINKANPLGYELLGKLSYSTGNIINSRLNFEKARDTAIFRLGTPPSTTCFIQREIKEQALKHDVDIIDLPEIFSNYTQDIPGNDLFIDYCHLTVEGIDVAMNHTANTVLQKLGMSKASIKQFKIFCDNEVMGKAHFLSAIHCAHSGDQPYDTLHYHCIKALQHSNEIKVMMIKYIDLATRKVPWVLNKNYEMMFKEKYTGIRQMGDCKIMDIRLVTAMINALKTVDIDLKEQTDELRKQEHSPKTGRSIDLLETYYRENSYFNSFAESKSVDYDSRKQCFKSERNIMSSFSLIADHNVDYNAELTLRIESYGGTDKKASIKLNGKLLEQVSLSDQWTDLELYIPKQFLNSDGVNEITIHWPLFDELEEVISENYKSRYSGSQLILQRSRPVYGEVIRFNISIKEDR
jgi:hypothetical protein